MKQVLATDINHSRVRFLEPTSTGVICHMRDHGRGQCGARTHDPEFARQAPYPIVHRSPLLPSENHNNWPGRVKYRFIIHVL